MTLLFPNLTSKAQKGSKPRCHLLTHDKPQLVAEQLSELIAPIGLVSAQDKWMPLGFDDTREAQLHNAPRLLDKYPFGETLKSWWLAVNNPNPTTPNWDIACSCSIDGEPGLLLVEAKAHEKELNPKDRCEASNENNRKSIKQAVCEANDALNKIKSGWNLSHKHHYQLSNRFAWSWKLANLGIPVALVYLGFVNANEMDHPFKNAQAWKKAVYNYGKGVVPESVWGNKLMINNVPLYPIIHSTETELKPIELSCHQIELGA